MLWQMYYDMWFELYHAEHTPENEYWARVWADHMRCHNRTPRHYETSVYHV